MQDLVDRGVYRCGEEGWLRSDVPAAEARVVQDWAHKQQVFRQDPLNDGVEHVTTLAEALEAEAQGLPAVVEAAAPADDEDASYEKVHCCHF
jgi:hypothetical protein